MRARARARVGVILVLSKVVTRRLGAAASGEQSPLQPAAAMDMLRTVAVANYGARCNPNPNANANPPILTLTLTL